MTVPRRGRAGPLAALALGVVTIAGFGATVLTGASDGGARAVVDTAPAPGAAPRDTMPRFGINLSGAEAKANDAVRPSMDDVRNAIDRLQFDLIRYPFRPDRMTPDRIAELRGIVDFARSRRVPVILDNHSSRWQPVPDQIAFWSGLARRFPDDGSVLLDLVNEPRRVPWMQWATDAKAVIAGLRKAGIRHPILLEWPGYSGITRFDKHEPSSKECASAACALERTPGPLDPADNTFLNGHRYFDADGSGTKAACKKKDGQPRTESGFDRFAAQLRKRGWKGYITESAFGGYGAIPASCRAVGEDAVADLRANGDVLLGVTWWGGGRMWPDRYPFKIECAKAERMRCPLSDYQRMIRPAPRGERGVGR